MSGSRAIFGLIASLSLAGTMAGAVQAQQSARGGESAGAVEEPTPAVVGQTFTAWDTDGNGVLSRLEFENGWKSIRRLRRDHRQALRKRFDEMDANRNRAIDPDEYRRLTLIQHAGRAAPPLSDFDTNGNGRLEFDEYMALVRRQSAAGMAAGHGRGKR